jgi:hypothetical protein
MVCVEHCSKAWHLQLANMQLHHLHQEQQQEQPRKKQQWQQQQHLLSLKSVPWVG